MEKKLRILVYAGFCALHLTSCGDSYLDVKSRSNLAVPHTLADFQQLLDNGNLMLSYPDMLDVLSDDYYLAGAYWQGRNEVVRNAHVWAGDIYGTTESYPNAWDRMYSQVLYANVVLDGLRDMDQREAEPTKYSQVKGAAYFFRAYALFNLAQLYVPAYGEQTGDTPLGLPIPLSADVNEQMVRSNVSDTYDHILSDLETAEGLLAAAVDFSRPSKTAAQALSARINLYMGRYDSALLKAGQVLESYDRLTDLSTEALDFKKTILLGYDPSGPLIQANNQNIMVPDELYASYAENDRRRTFFGINSQSKPFRRPSYDLGLYNFRGLDTDEQFLIRAECKARKGNIQTALDDVNHLLRHMHDETFIDLTASTTEEALAIILLERRKQLIFRGVRWSDLKRLNRDGANIVLSREMDGQEYLLEPNDPRWLFPIPPNEIMTSGISQNLR